MHTLCRSNSASDGLCPDSIQPITGDKLGSSNWCWLSSAIEYWCMKFDSVPCDGESFSLSLWVSSSGSSIEDSSADSCGSKLSLWDWNKLANEIWLTLKGGPVPCVSSFLGGTVVQHSAPWFHTDPGSESCSHTTSVVTLLSSASPSCTLPTPWSTRIPGTGGADSPGLSGLFSTSKYSTSPFPWFIRIPGTDVVDSSGTCTATLEANVLTSLDE